jgi:hypothetical protein
LEAGWRARASQEIKNFQAFAIFNQTQISIKLNLLNLNKTGLCETWDHPAKELVGCGIKFM